MPKGIYQHKKGYKRLPFSEEWKRKIALAHKGKKISKETKLKISLSGKGKNIGKIRSDISKQKNRKSHIGKKHSEETKLKISYSAIGKKHEYCKGEKSNFWKGGKSFELYGFEWTDLLKHSIRTRDCFTCKMCKKNGWCVHHIDYNKKNNNPINLITLCSSCHGKTNTNRDYWIEYFKIIC